MDLTAVLVATTIPRLILAFVNVSTKPLVIFVPRSKFNVYTRLHMMVANVSRIRVRDISTNADGTTLNTKDSPSANINASNGATTVVFPAPMIICLTLETSTFKC